MPVIGATQLEPVNYLGQYLGGVEAARGMRRARMEEEAYVQAQEEKRAAAERDAQLRNFLSTADLSSAETQNALMRMPGGAAILKQFGEARESLGKGVKAETEGLAGRMQYFRQNIPFNPAGAANWLQNAYSDPMVGPELAKMGTLEEAIAGIPQEPAAYLAWMEGVSNLADKYVERRVPDAESMLPYERMTRAEQARVGLEGQRVGLERQRVGLEGRRVALAEQRVAQGANAAAGTPAAIDPKTKQKRDAAFPKVQQAFKSATHDIGTLIRDLEELRSHPGLASITGGIEGRLPSVRESSTGAQALLDRVLSKGQLRSLTQLRENSPTGGALGNVSNQDLQVLRDAFAAFNQSQGAEDFKRRIDQTINDLRFTDQNLRTAFEEEYSYRNAPAAGASQSVFDEADRILRGE
jgi:hypothetical protein